MECQGKTKSFQQAGLTFGVGSPQQSALSRDFPVEGSIASKMPEAQRAEHVYQLPSGLQGQSLNGIHNLATYGKLCVATLGLQLSFCKGNGIADT